MNKIISLSSVILITLLLSTVVASSVCTMYFVRMNVDVTIQNGACPPHRAEVNCTISKNNINFSVQDIDPASITAYELYDSDGDLIVGFTDKHNFLSYLFSQHGDFEIRFYTDQFILYGEIQLK